jgi:hypothetical protein
MSLPKLKIALDAYSLFYLIRKVINKPDLHILVELLIVQM